MACTVCVTAAPPSPASLLALVAMPSVTLALSLFWVIEADIVSIEAVVSSTDAACSLAACDRLCAVALTWLAAPVSASAAARTSSMMLASLSQLALASFLTWSNMPSASPRDALRQVAVGQAREHAADVLDDGRELLAGGVGIVLDLAEGAGIVAGDALRSGRPRPARRRRGRRRRRSPRWSPSACSRRRTARRSGRSCPRAGCAGSGRRRSAAAVTGLRLLHRLRSMSLATTSAVTSVAILTILTTRPISSLTGA